MIFVSKTFFMLCCLKAVHLLQSTNFAVNKVWSNFSKQIVFASHLETALKKKHLKK